MSFTWVSIAKDALGQHLPFCPNQVEGNEVFEVIKLHFDYMFIDHWSKTIDNKKVKEKTVFFISAVSIFKAARSLV